MKPNVETMIEDLVQAVHGNKSAREKFLLREALRNLVRLAKAEQMMEIRTNVSAVTRGATENPSRRKEKVDSILKLETSSDLFQKRLEFGDDRPLGATNRAKLHSARHGH